MTFDVRSDPPDSATRRTLRAHAMDRPVGDRSCVCNLCDFSGGCTGRCDAIYCEEVCGVCPVSCGRVVRVFDPSLTALGWPSLGWRFRPDVRVLRGPVADPGGVDWVVPAHQLWRWRGRFVPRWPEGIRGRWRIHPESRIVLSYCVRDALLGDVERVDGAWQQWAALDADAHLAPDFSLYDNWPRAEHLRNIRRRFERGFEIFETTGRPVIPSADFPVLIDWKRIETWSGGSPRTWYVNMQKVKSLSFGSSRWGGPFVRRILSRFRLAARSGVVGQILVVGAGHARARARLLEAAGECDVVFCGPVKEKPDAERQSGADARRNV